MKASYEILAGTAAMVPVAAAIVAVSSLSSQEAPLPQAEGRTSGQGLAHDAHKAEVLAAGSAGSTDLLNFNIPNPATYAPEANNDTLITEILWCGGGGAVVVYGASFLSSRLANDGSIKFGNKNRSRP